MYGSDAHSIHTVPLQVLSLFPIHEDDGKDLDVERISQYLQPWVQQFLQLGSRTLKACSLSADMLSCPKLLFTLLLRHLELDIGKSSSARLSKIMVALNQGPTLEYLVISVHAAFETLQTQVKLPDLCLHNATDLKHISFQACFPAGQIVFATRLPITPRPGTTS